MHEVVVRRCDGVLVVPWYVSVVRAVIDNRYTHHQRLAPTLSLSSAVCAGLPDWYPPEHPFSENTLTIVHVPFFTAYKKVRGRAIFFFFPK